MNSFKFAFSTLCSIFILTSLPATAQGLPEVTSIGGNLRSDQVISLHGNGFGIKETPQPITFHRFEEDEMGKLPNGWKSYQKVFGTVNNRKAYSGKHSLDTSAHDLSEGYFPRITYDIESGIEPGDVLFLSAWLYLDKTGSTASNWNWKGPMLTSGLTPNYWSHSTPHHGVVGFAGFFQEDHGWYNPAVAIQYDHSIGGITSGVCAQGNGWQRDAFIFNKWQRIDWVFQASSTPAAADGRILINRVGANTPPLNATGCTTHGDQTNPWRYINLPQGYTNIFNYGSTTENSSRLILNAKTNALIEPGLSIHHSVNGLLPDDTTVVSYDGDKTIIMSNQATATDIGAVTFGGIPPQLNLEMYIDDLYIDRSLARVELGDKKNYNDCTKRELQLLTNWQNNRITFTLNQGGFTPGQDLFLFVVDEQGNVSQGHGPVTLEQKAAPAELWLLLESAIRQRE